MSKIAGRNFRPVRRDRIPGCTYTEPQIGSAGLTEAQGEGEGLHRQGGKIPVRGQLQGDDCGQPRRLREERVGRKVWRDSGVHIIGPQATELIAEAGGGDGVGGHGGGDDVHDPRASDAVGSDAGWLRRGGRHGNQRIRERRRRCGAVRLPTPIMRRDPDSYFPDARSPCGLTRRAGRGRIPLAPSSDDSNDCSRRPVFPAP